LSAPEPLRHLFPPGLAVWAHVWSASVYEATQPTVVELVQLVCEQIDERFKLRVEVLNHGQWRDRAALRALDQQIAANLSVIAERMAGGVSDLTSSLSDLLAEMDDPT